MQVTSAKQKPEEEQANSSFYLEKQQCEAYEQIRKWSTSSNNSDECSNRQASRLQAIDEKPKIQEEVGYFFSKWIWALGEWSRRTNQEPHKHNQIHQERWGTQGQEKRYNVWILRLQQSPREENKKKKPDLWYEFNCLFCGLHFFTSKINSFLLVNLGIRSRGIILPT